MNKRLAAALNAFLIAAMFAIALWAIYELPAGGQVAIHWGPDGQPDAWIGEWAGLLIIPIIACVLWFLLSVSPQGFSFPGKPIQPADVRRTVFFRVLLIQLAAQTLIAINAVGREVDTSRYISIALGMLYIVAGAGFRQLQWNFAWIRNSPFEEAVREKSQRAGRWIFGLSGLGIVVVAFGMQQGDKVLGVFILTIGAPLLTVLYSYLVSRRRSH
jgi:uncharacterized membrane protein